MRSGDLVAIFSQNRLLYGIGWCFWCYFLQNQPGNAVSEWQTDRWTDTLSDRDAKTHLKKMKHLRSHGISRILGTQLPPCAPITCEKNTFTILEALKGGIFWLGQELRASEPELPRRNCRFSLPLWHSPTWKRERGMEMIFVSPLKIAILRVWAREGGEIEMGEGNGRRNTGICCLKCIYTTHILAHMAYRYREWFVLLLVAPSKASTEMIAVWQSICAFCISMSGVWNQTGIVETGHKMAEMADSLENHQKHHNYDNRANRINMLKKGCGCGVKRIRT